MPAPPDAPDRHRLRKAAALGLATSPPTDWSGAYATDEKARRGRDSDERRQRQDARDARAQSKGTGQSGKGTVTGLPAPSEPALSTTTLPPCWDCSWPGCGGENRQTRLNCAQCNTPRDMTSPGALAQVENMMAAATAAAKRLRAQGAATVPRQTAPELAANELLDVQLAHWLTAQAGDDGAPTAEATAAATQLRGESASGLEHLRLATLRRAAEATARAAVPATSEQAAEAAARVSRVLEAQAERRGSKRKTALKEGDMIKIANWNMARTSKLQLQHLDQYNYDVVFLPETHNTAVPLMHYRGHNRLLASNKGKAAWAADSAGACAFRLSERAAQSLDTWDVIQGSGGRAMWLQLRTNTKGNQPLIIVGGYSPPHRRNTFPTQSDVLLAMTKFITTLPKRAIVVVLGDFNAQMTREVRGQTGRWCLRTPENMHRMASAQKKASAKLHQFAENCGLFAANTGQAATPTQRGGVATWKLPQRGSDGRVKCVTLDWVFMNPAAMHTLQNVRCRWLPSRVRWGRSKHDHALQEITMKLRVRPFVPAPTAGRNVNRYYRVDENAARLEAGFATAAAATGLKVDALADALSKSTTELPAGDLQKLLDTSYRGLVQELQRVHGRLKKEDAAAAKRQAEVAAAAKANRGVPGGARVSGEAPKTFTSNGLEWAVSAKTAAIIEERTAAILAAEASGGQLSAARRNEFAKRIKASTADDAAAWVDTHVGALKALDKDPQRYHEYWGMLERRGRQWATGQGRFFQADGEPAVTTLEEETAGWEGYMAEKYTETAEEAAAVWEMLPDTRGTELSAAVIDAVLASAKEGKATGIDDTTVTFYTRSPTARAIVVTMLQLMWKFEAMPKDLPVVLQLMLHKEGRSFNERGNYRPITLLNDLLKLFDGCLYYVLAREMGVIREPPPGETEVRPCYLAETQRAFRQKYSGLDLLIITKMTQWRTQACGLILLDTLTDLAGAFDTIGHKAMDRALGAAGASAKARNLYRMVYSQVKCRVRSRGAGGGVADSVLYDLNRGGCQGSILMPLLFIVLAHYVYLKHDGGRDGLFGPGEAIPGRRMPRCGLCRKFFPVWEYTEAGADDGHCRACQIVRALPLKATDAPVAAALTRQSAGALEQKLAMSDTSQNSEDTGGPLTSDGGDDAEVDELEAMMEALIEGQNEIEGKVEVEAARSARLQELQVLHADACGAGGDRDDGDGADEEHAVSAIAADATTRMTAAAKAIVWAVGIEEAVDQAEAFLVDHMWGWKTLVMRSLEFADDQKMLEAMEMIPHCPRERKLEERVLARIVQRRLERFAIGAYNEAGLIIEMTKCSVQWGQAPRRSKDPITEAEIGKLELPFTCQGCGRAEASFLTKQGHEHHCAYVRLLDSWTNPAGDDGEWEVDAILDVRGPPDHRFYKLQWGGGRTDSVDDRIDDGSWLCNWQPAANVAGCAALQHTFWQVHPKVAACRHESIESYNDDGSKQLRCRYCNEMGFKTEPAYKRHVGACAFRPTKRQPNSVAGRMVGDRRSQDAQAEWPLVKITATDGKTHSLKAKLHERYLGHLSSADGSTEADMRRRMRLADVGFWKSQHLWTHPRIRRRDKLRMFRRYVMRLVYGGADTWLLTGRAQRALNHWTGRKVALITGRTAQEEFVLKTVNIVDMLRHWRRRRIGEILRSHDNDPRKQELLPHAELVRRGWLPKAGGLLMDVPAFASVEQLERLAGRMPSGAWNADGGAGLIARARAEQAKLRWLAMDAELQPTYGNASDEENDDAGNGGKDGEDDKDGDGDDDGRAATTRKRDVLEAAEAARQIKMAAAAAGGRYCWLVYHDGGYGKGGDEMKCGWGYWIQTFETARITAAADGTGLPAAALQELCYGSVIVDDMSDPRYCGCIVRSNNTAELSAVPHILVHCCTLRRQQLGAARQAYHDGAAAAWGLPPATLILAYDSAYTHEQCTGRLVPAATNTTVIAVCRRLLREAESLGIDVTWVKVRGHSKAAATDATVIGNTWADKAADYGQEGRSRKERSVATYIADWMGLPGHYV